MLPSILFVPLTILAVYTALLFHGYLKKQAPSTPVLILALISSIFLLLKAYPLLTQVKWAPPVLSLAAATGLTAISALLARLFPKQFGTPGIDFG